MDEYTKKRIEREKNKKINEMIASELADEIIPESDVEAARELCLEYDDLLNRGQVPAASPLQ